MPIVNGISEVELKGFKSIKSLKSLSLRNLNVFIGANGSGKTNFISFFKMLQFYLNSSDGLIEYVNQNGGADFLLYFGSKATSTISARVSISTSRGINDYYVEFGTAIGDKLYFKDEKVTYSAHHLSGKNTPIPLGSGGKESRLLQIGKHDPDYARYYKTIETIKILLKGMCFYQFHDTTPDARIRKACHINDNQYLRSDGGNLASFLYTLREHEPRAFKSILEITKQIAPYIGDIIIENEYSSPFVKLKWKESFNKNYLFDVGQMSDGTLRAIALITLLTQPRLPSIICIDEPELGLHPEAIAILADLLKCASEKSQIIVSTQSPTLIDYLEPEDIIVVNRAYDETLLERLEYDKYKEWLDKYSLSQIWNTNIFGGRP